MYSMDLGLGYKLLCLFCQDSSTSSVSEYWSHSMDIHNENGRIKKTAKWILKTTQATETNTAQNINNQSRNQHEKENEEKVCFPHQSGVFVFDLAL